jgi:hypothetical protein
MSCATKFLRGIENSAGIFRKIINTIDPDKFKNIIGSDNPKAWAVITSCLDLLEDTNEAIWNYCNFGSTGPTKCPETGELYLRIYGVLSAVYLQFSALEDIAEISKLNKKRECLLEIRKLKIIRLRHIAAAHTVNFREFSKEGEGDNKKKIIKYHMIRRIDLDMGLICINDENDNFEEYEIDKLILEYLNHSTKLIFKILKEAIKRIYKHSKEKMEKYLHDVYIEETLVSKNSFVHTCPDGSKKLIITSKVQPKKQKK